MRTPNTKCDICNKSLYRRPYELKKCKSFCCKDCRSELYKKREPSQNLKLGRQKGTNHLNGIPKSQTYKAKMKIKISKWCKENPDKVKARGEKVRGENHYNWNGGSTKLNKSIRMMTEYRKWQKAIKKRDGNCQHCGSKTELEVHHVIPLAMLFEKHKITDREGARDCSELWNIKNGLTLCRKCHYKLDNRRYNDNN
jgi:hypothetical protein